MSHLGTYLNDHIAGSVVAIDMLKHLESSHPEAEWQEFFRQLRTDIESDRRELELLMRELGIDQSKLRKGVAWVSERFTEVKLQLDDPADGNLRLFESLEALSLGIEGKRGLWLALAETTEKLPKLLKLDYGRLIFRATEQRQRVEDRRLILAREALPF